MGYLHIDNLYKNQDILAFRTCYALEKIHGTSAHLTWKGGTLTFFSGGESHGRFITLFDHAALTALLLEKFGDAAEVTIYGEAYGGKQQGMSPTYGKELRFVAFDVEVGGVWLKVPDAAALASSLGLEFVHFDEIETSLAALDAARDAPSVQSVRNGVEGEKLREGVVLRPPFEVTKSNGARVIAKHKREEFAERGRPAVDLDPTKAQEKDLAESIASEWVNVNRLDHVLDHLLAKKQEKVPFEHKDIPAVIAAMVEDVEREGSGEMEMTKEVRKAVAARTVALFKERLTPLF